MGMEDICLVEVGLGQLFMCPVSQPFPFVRGEFIATQEDANRLQGEPPCGGILWSISVVNCLFSVIIHLTVELGVPREIIVLPVVILVSLDMGVVSGKGQVTAVNHDVF